MSEVQRTVFVVRHGHRADLTGELPNEEWRRTAKRPHDPPLSEVGFEQVRRLAHRLAAERIDHVFASPFLRTVQTAHAIAEAQRVPCRIETALHEWLNPQWFAQCPDMLPLKTLRQHCPTVDVGYIAPDALNYPEVDEKAECWPRVRSCVERLLSEYRGNLCLVGHGASVVGACSALGDIGGLTLSMACLIRFDQVDGRWERTLSGCTKHLSEGEGSGL